MSFGVKSRVFEKGFTDTDTVLNANRVRTAQPGKVFLTDNKSESRHFAAAPDRVHRIQKLLVQITIGLK